MSDIFVSYAREDRTLAEALANDLKTHGYAVWWDTELVGSDAMLRGVCSAGGFSGLASINVRTRRNASWKKWRESQAQHWQRLFWEPH